MIQNKWLKAAVELQSLAQAGLTYGRDVYDLERYTRIREISAELLASLADEPIEKVRDIFCCEKGYQTPKLDCRAAIIEDEKILLVRENDGLWALPGGFCDVGLSVKENIIKEAREEAGVIVDPVLFIAFQEQNRRNHPVDAFQTCKAFVLCRYLGGSFQPNSETTECRWFGEEEELPPLATRKTTEEQIALCFRAGHNQDHWQTELD